MAVVYDKEGKEFKCEPVDARELIDSGEYFKEPQEDKPKRGPKPKSDKGKVEEEVSEE